MMGDTPAAAKNDTKRSEASMVSVRICSSAHVDVADLDAGQVSKTTPLVVSAVVARGLLARHPYLEASEG
jgi:hypothetical protein